MRSLLALTVLLLAAAIPAADNALENRLMLGVYVPWERCNAQAKVAGKDLDTFVDETMRQVAEDLHGNTVWFVNGPGPEVAGPTMAAAERHGITVMAQTAMVGMFVHGMRDTKQLDEQVAVTVENLATQPSLGAYVLKDEAKTLERAQMDMYRAALAAADPKHPSIIVTMTSHTEAYAQDSGFPIICTDIYHFGGDNSPYIPNPARRSQGSYRATVAALVDMCRQSGKVPWVMPQSFADIWGPWWVDDAGNVVIEPGSYWHWRMSTPAEMKWQTWEAIRQGSRGVVYFPLFDAPPHGWRPGQGDMPERMAKAMESNVARHIPLVQEPVHTNQPACLTGPGGSLTDAARALGVAFAEIGRHAELLVALTPSGVPAAFVDAPAAAATYQRAGDAARYVIVVNDDLEEARMLPVQTLPHCTSVTDLRTDSALALSPTPVAETPMQTFAVTLDPGAGMILRLEFNGNPGGLVYDEQFRDVAVTATLENAARTWERRGFGMGQQPAVRKTGGIDDASAIVLDKLKEHHHGRGSYLAGALHSVAKGLTRVYLLVDGYAPSPEDIVVSLHDADGKPGWNKTDAYHLPMAIPADTTAIRIRLTPNASVRRIRLFRTPVAAE